MTLSRLADYFTGRQFGYKLVRRFHDLWTCLGENSLLFSNLMVGVFAVALLKVKFWRQLEGRVLMIPHFSLLRRMELSLRSHL